MNAINTLNVRPTILIVDDSPFNIDILDDILNKYYNLKFAINGDIALMIAEKFIPDIILLDIMMPGIDGYEVCRRLKANPITKDIPVIFVTAKDDAIDEMKGFELGAVDYITKPVSAPVVLARVKTYLTLYYQSKNIEKLIDEKVREIVEKR